MLKNGLHSYAYITNLPKEFLFKCR